MFGKKKRKGQSALEYLVTYGWAILAIVIIAAVLWYFGIFNPSGWTGTATTAKGFAVISVTGQKWSATTLNLSIGNTVGQDINITTFKLDGTPYAFTSGKTGYNYVQLSAGATDYLGSIVVPNCGTTGTPYSDKTIEITYDNLKTGFTGYKDTGTISGRCS